MAIPQEHINFNQQAVDLSIHLGFESNSVSTFNDKPEKRKAEINESLTIRYVLRKAQEDGKFWGELFTSPGEALASLNLSNEAKAAIICGDVNWVKKHVPGITDDEMLFLYTRLECEVW